MEYQAVMQKYYGSQSVLASLEEKLNKFDRKRVNNESVLKLRDLLGRTFLVRTR